MQIEAVIKYIKLLNKTEGADVSRSRQDDQEQK